MVWSHVDKSDLVTNGFTPNVSLSTGGNSTPTRDSEVVKSTIGLIETTMRRMGSVGTSSQSSQGDHSHPETHNNGESILQGYGILFIAILLTLALLTKPILDHWKCLSCVPISTYWIFLGFLSAVFFIGKEDETLFNVESMAIYYVLLPPILLKSGYLLEKSLYCSTHVTMIFALSLLGLLLSSVFVAKVLHLLAVSGVVSITADPFQCFMIGMMLSSTDSVAITSLLSSPQHPFVSIRPKMRRIILGEGILNEIVAIMFFMAVSGIGEIPSSSSIFGVIYNAWFGSFGIGVSTSILAGAAGAVIGLMTSVVSAQARFLKKYPTLELMVTFVTLTASYFLGGSNYGSRIVAVYSCQLVLLRYHCFNISKASRATLEITSSLAGQIAEAAVYLLVVPFIAIAVVLCVVSRGIATFMQQQHSSSSYGFMKDWLALQFSIVIVNEERYAGATKALPRALSNKEVLMTTILAIVLITTALCVLCGMATLPKDSQARDNSFDSSFTKKTIAKLCDDLGGADGGGGGKGHVSSKPTRATSFLDSDFMAAAAAVRDEGLHGKDTVGDVSDK
eukprot:jgi/Bigna1/67990/fgenesh1_pg.5_\